MLISRTLSNKCFCFQKFFSKCRHYSKHLLQNKKYHVTKNTMTSIFVFYTNVSNISVPPELEKEDAYIKSVIDILVLVSKKYQYLGIEIIDVLTIIIVVGIIRNFKTT